MKTDLRTPHISPRPASSSSSRHHHLSPPAQSVPLKTRAICQIIPGNNARHVLTAPRDATHYCLPHGRFRTRAVASMREPRCIQRRSQHHPAPLKHTPPAISQTTLVQPSVREIMHQEGWRMNSLTRPVTYWLPRRFVHSRHRLVTQRQWHPVGWVPTADLSQNRPNHTGTLLDFVA